MTAIDITPPRIIDTEMSHLASGRSEGLCHRSCTAEACRKRLYGTTVVPMSPTRVNTAPAGMVGMNIPFSSAGRAGATMTAVVTKVRLMRITSATRNLSRSL